MNKVRTNKGSFAKRNSSNFRSNGNNRTFGGNRNFNRGGRAKGVSSNDIHAFIQRATKNNEVVEEVVIKHTFADFNFIPEIKTNLDKKGYINPTPIQDQSILPIMEGRDLIGLANTGTGKTAAFLLPLIQKVYKDRNQKVLIIAPTRELALQIEAELREFAWGMKIFYTSCVGGLPIGKQIRGLQMRQDFVIGTPGRIKDLAKRGFINFGTFNNVVLDEVDRMLDMGFVDEIRYFLSCLPVQRQSLFFSATMPDKIRALVQTFANDPFTVQVKSGDTSANVDQDVIKVEGGSKMLILQSLLSQPELEKVLIFGDTKRQVERLANDLAAQGYKAESIHGDKRQGQRAKALSAFKNDEVDILVATDVAARGLDIKM